MYAVKLLVVLLALVYVAQAQSFATKCILNLKICNGRCKPRGVCKRILPLCPIVCTCNEGFYGKYCKNKVTTTMPTTTDLTSINETEANTTTNGGQAEANTTASTTKTTSTDTNEPDFTKCMGGTKCYNGNCTRNSWKCRCEPNWRGYNCNKPCILDCGIGHCLYVNQSATTPTCNCPMNDTHDFDASDGCRITRTTTRPSILIGYIPRESVTDVTVPRPHTAAKSGDYWLIVGIVIGILVIVIVAVVIALTIMWKKRAIFVLKLVYRFKAYVDEEEKDFDAFISYKSSSVDHTSSQEELFVINSLIPKLEREYGFKICVHFRDFVPGMDITDNVLKAIENSHRTIMLISRAYVTESIWTKFEYEQAQVAVIHQKQRIIPVLFDDLDELTITDPTLKLILASTTYLQKPPNTDDVNKMDEFWTRLRLSMPKKRASSTLVLTDISLHPHGHENGVKQLDADNKSSLPTQMNVYQNGSMDKIHSKSNGWNQTSDDVICERYTKYLYP